LLDYEAFKIEGLLVEILEK